jgi:hypothetical protein
MHLLAAFLPLLDASVNTSCLLVLWMSALQATGPDADEVSTSDPAQYTAPHLSAVPYHHGILQGLTPSAGPTGGIIPAAAPATLATAPPEYMPATSAAAAATMMAAAPASGNYSGNYSFSGVAAARPAAAAAGVPSNGGLGSTHRVSGSRVATGTRAGAVAEPQPRVTSARPGRGLANLFSSPSVFLSRAMTPSLCRYESMDALQHLSPEGFIHSWLPSYSNPSKVGYGSNQSVSG